VIPSNINPGIHEAFGVTDGVIDGVIDGVEDMVGVQGIYSYARDGDGVILIVGVIDIVGVTLIVGVIVGVTVGVTVMVGVMLIDGSGSTHINSFMNTELSP